MAAPGSEERLRFWLANAPVAMMALKKTAPNGDYRNLVVIITDMRDVVARTITEAIGQIEKVDIPAHEAKAEKKGEIPTGILVLEVALTAEVFEETDHPGIAAGLRRVPPPGHIRAVIVSSGAVMLLHPPIIRVPEAGQS